MWISRLLDHFGDNAVFDLHAKIFARRLGRCLVPQTNSGAYGQGIGIRWINPGGHLTFRFDLSDVSSARLAGYIDSISPALTDGGNFRLSASGDGKDWSILLDGRGPWAWREVDLSSYAGKEVFVRLANPSDKGQARVRKWRLTTVP